MTLYILFNGIISSYGVLKSLTWSKPNSFRIFFLSYLALDLLVTRLHHQEKGWWCCCLQTGWQVTFPPLKYHSTQSVSNIKNEICIVLDRETTHYSNWVELFETHCHPCNVLDNINPKIPQTGHLRCTLGTTWLRSQEVDLWHDITRPSSNYTLPRCCGSRNLEYN